MSELREWFVANRPIIFFVYGQVFFVMGIAIVLQSRRYSRLELARSLPWLAAFGITHGFNEWGDLFIPIQAAFLPDSAIQVLRTGLTVLLAVSFACLMQFGVELLRPFPDRLKWLRGIPIGVLTLWLIGPFLIVSRVAPDPDTGHAISRALARYLIGFPSGLLAAYGLRRHARMRIAPLGMPRIYNTLRWAGLALAAYAVLTGLIVRPAPFFPANVFNSEWLAQIVIVPTQVFRSLAGLLLAVAIIRALEVFEVETDRLIEQMEQAQVIAIERERIGRELHDGTIQRVYAAGLLVDSLRRKANGPLADGLDRLVSSLNDVIAELRHSLSDLRGSDSTADLSAALTAMADEVRRASGVDLMWTPAPLPGLSPDRVTHLIAFAREALSNAVRHAQAHRIEMNARHADGRLQLIIRDDGRGFPTDMPRGYGLRNMRDRARLLGGEVTFASGPGKGATVTLTIPLERET